ncbi:hypothetical protein K501DRAFT_321289 [Backusella circina FSU 941]|nr:hypothetical protein K501DRAFT_321289 [Backusella circina FSU 941]
MSLQDNNELISFDDIPANNNSNIDINSEKDSIHSFNGSDDKDTERTSFDEEEEQEEETKTSETIVKEEEQVSHEANHQEEERHVSMEENQQENIQNEQDDEFADFGDFDDDNNNDDDFGDFDDEFTGATDDFGDFTDEPELPTGQQQQEEDSIPKAPTTAELYCNVLNENNKNNTTAFIDDHLNNIMNPNNTILSLNTEPKQVLSTPCSQELWDRLSRDSVFFNSVTGTVGQFQWIRSETNKSYLNALGVTINYDEKTGPSTNNNNNARTAPKKRHTTLPLDTSTIIKSPTAMSAPSTPDGITSHSRSASATLSDGLRVAQPREEDKEAKKEAEQELELDIDIARAYCELTEETIRIFPDVKLNAMVNELKRLQRQAADYLDALLDQREQLLMDAETYNDLISCIVGHAQRLREQNKDASPAMVQKKKTGGKLSGLMRKKATPVNAQSVSMGGGVVGVKQQQKKTLSANESRRSL